MSRFGDTQPVPAMPARASTRELVQGPEFEIVESLRKYNVSASRTTSKTMPIAVIPDGDA